MPSLYPKHEKIRAHTLPVPVIADAMPKRELFPLLDAVNNIGGASATGCVHIDQGSTTTNRTAILSQIAQDPAMASYISRTPTLSEAVAGCACPLKLGPIGM